MTNDNIAKKKQDEHRAMMWLLVRSQGGRMVIPRAFLARTIPDWDKIELRFTADPLTGDVIVEAGYKGPQP